MSELPQTVMRCEILTGFPNTEQYAKITIEIDTRNKTVEQCMSIVQQTQEFFKAQVGANG